MEDNPYRSPSEGGDNVDPPVEKGKQRIPRSTVWLVLSLFSPAIVGIAAALFVLVMRWLAGE
jgi:hypothetical protein